MFWFFCLFVFMLLITVEFYQVTDYPESWIFCCSSLIPQLFPFSWSLFGESWNKFHLQHRQLYMWETLKVFKDIHIKKHIQMPAAWQENLPKNQSLSKTWGTAWDPSAFRSTLTKLEEWHPVGQYTLGSPKQWIEVIQAFKLLFKLVSQ